MTLPLTDAKPACSLEGTQPGWWDIETHTHTYKRRCMECATAVKICGECPLQQRCRTLGRDSATPALIYAGVTFSTSGQVLSCTNCQNPITGHGGRYSYATALCSSECRKEHKARGEADFYPESGIVVG